MNEIIEGSGARMTQDVRTGLFRYVRWARLNEFLRRGWLPVAHLGPTHGQWSVFCWHCECGEVAP